MTGARGGSGSAAGASPARARTASAGDRGDAGAREAGGHRGGARGTGAREAGEALLCGAGLACLLGTYPLCSTTVTPLQRFGAISSWIGPCAIRMQAIAVVACAIVLIWRVLGLHRPGDVPLALIGGGLFALGSAAFSAAAVYGMPGALAGGAGVWLVALLVGVGGVLFSLSWGRVAAGMSRRASLGAVGVGAVGQAGIGVLVSALSGAPTVVAYAGFALCSLALALVATLALRADSDGDASGAGEVAGAVDDVARQSGHDPLERLRSFLAVSGTAILGMVAYAFVTGTMRALVMGHYTVQVCSLALCGLVLVAACLAWPRRRGSFLRVASRVAIPLLCLLVLSVGNIAAALGMAPYSLVTPTYLLYTFAALLTLAMLAAMAHAREFDPDVIFATLVATFCLTSFAGIALAEALSDGQVLVLMTVVTTLYAIATVLSALVGRGRADDADAEAGANALAGAGVGDPARGSDPGAAPGGASDAEGAEGAAGADIATDWERDLERRCALLADRYGLTARETEIMGLVARGHGSAYISETLYISRNTVRTHVHNLYAKLGVSSREQVMALVRGMTA